jgi:hypothetical protein
MSWDVQLNCHRPNPTLYHVRKGNILARFFGDARSPMDQEAICHRLNRNRRAIRIRISLRDRARIFRVPRRLILGGPMTTSPYRRKKRTNVNESRKTE